MADNITLKNLGDIPVVEELSDSTHLLAEQDGAYARVPKDKVGVTSWNDLPDRPFGEESIRIEWDGVVGDRVCAMIGELVFFAKVADATISKDALNGAKVVMIANGEAQESVIPESMIEDMGGMLFVGGGAICVVENPGRYSVKLMGGATAYNVDFSEVGTYFMLMTTQNPPIYVSYLECSTIKTIDPKYLPSGAGGGGGALVVTITPDSDMQNGVADVDAAAIIAAITAGQHVYAALSVGGGMTYLVMQLTTYMPSANMVKFGMLDASAYEAYEATMVGGTDCSIVAIDLKS